MSSHLKTDLMCMSQSIIIILLLIFSLRQEDLRSISNHHLKACSLNNHQSCHLPGSINAQKVAMGTERDPVTAFTSLIPWVEDWTRVPNSGNYICANGFQSGGGHVRWGERWFRYISDISSTVRSTPSSTKNSRAAALLRLRSHL